MIFGSCPNCANKLTEESSLITKASEIFKGNNHYLICGSCQQVLLYNKDRNMVFDLKEFQNDKDVLAEINEYLQNIDENLEAVAKEEVEGCTHNCANCSGCSEEQVPVYQGYLHNKRQQQEEEEKVNNNDMINAALDHSFLAVNKNDPSKKKLILETELNTLQIDEWIFFELIPVTIKAITTYEIERH